jgi:hypothetical protein
MSPEVMSMFHKFLQHLFAKILVVTSDISLAAAVFV